MIKINNYLKKMIEKNNNENLIPNIVDLLDEGNIESFIEYYKNPQNEAWNYKNKENGASILHVLIDKDCIDLLYHIVEITEKNTTDDNFRKFLNMKNNNGMTPFHLACYKGNMQLIKFFINKGAHYWLKSNTGLCCLHYSAITNKVTPIYYMNKKHGILLDKTDKNGNTFFHWACYTSSEKIIDFYLNDKSFEKNSQNKDGYTPLQYYLMTKSKRSIKRLIFCGADPYIRNKKNENSFDIINQIYKDDDYNKQNTLKLLYRKNYGYWQFWIFNFFHFFYPFLIIVFEFPFIKFKYFKTGLIIYIIWTLIICFFVIYFFQKDPGFIKINNNNNYLLELIEKEDNIDLSNYCIKCQNEKKIYTKHCFYCDRCVSGFDHHCIWFNRCIGKDNCDTYDRLIFLLLCNSLINLLLCIFASRNKKSMNFQCLVFKNVKVENFFKYLIFILYIFFFLGISIIIIPIIKFLYEQKKKPNNDYGIPLCNNKLTSSNLDNDESSKLLEEKD